jgi:hypothetical protein
MGTSDAAALRQTPLNSPILRANPTNVRDSIQYRFAKCASLERSARICFACREGDTDLRGDAGERSEVEENSLIVNFQ